jgi:RNA polymerase-binding transcription factor DksA
MEKKNINKQELERQNKKLKEENKNLKKALAVCSNKPLLNEIKSALNRIEQGEFVGKKEFFKQSPLK